MIKHKIIRRIVSALVAVVILLSAAVYVPGDFGSGVIKSKAADDAASSAEGDAASSGDAGTEEVAPDESSGGETSEGQDMTDGASDGENSDGASDGENIDDQDITDGEDVEEEEEVEEEKEKKERPYKDVVTPDDIKEGSIIRKNTLINMYGYDSYTLQIDDCVVEEYEEYDDEEVGLLLPDNVLVIVPTVDEPNTIFLETMPKGEIVLTEDALRTMLFNGEDITLGGNILLTRPIEISDGATHTINMNGNSIEYSDEVTDKDSVIIVTNGSKLILNDKKGDRAGEIRGGKAEEGGGIRLKRSSSLEMTGGNITGNMADEDGAGLYIDEGCTVNLDGTRIASNGKSDDDSSDGFRLVSFFSGLSSKGTCFSGGGVYVERGAICQLNDCQIESNSAKNGAGINNRGELSIFSSIVRGNFSNYWGGGIYNAGSVVIEDTIISTNKAFEDGGGINNHRKLVIKDSEVSDNIAGGNGGGIYICDNLSVEGKTICNGVNKITQNRARNGGGVYIVNDMYDGSFSRISLSGSTISRNVATRSGGGLYAGDDSNGLKLDAVTVESNNCEENGGGIYASSSLELVNCSIRLNTSSSRGGGVYADYGSSDAELTITGTAITENMTRMDAGGGIWIEDSASKENIIFGGGRTLITMNSAMQGNHKPNLGYNGTRKLKVTGRFERGSMISLVYQNPSDGLVLTKGYGDYNEEPVDTYFEYIGSGFKINPEEKLSEVTLKKKLLPSASGYKVSVQVKVTNDADDWDDAHVEFYAKKDNGVGEEYCVHSTGDIKSDIDHGGGVYNGSTNCGTAFPSKVNVYANFGGGLINRGWEADVKIWINDVLSKTYHIKVDVWGNTAKKGVASNWISIGGDKYPYPEDIEIEKKREIDLLDESSKEVSLTCVDQYGVKFEPKGEPIYENVKEDIGYGMYINRRVQVGTKPSFNMENVSFPGEDNFKCIDDKGNKWKFDTSKRDECHNSVYKLKVKSGSNLYPWVELPIPVRFKVPLKLKVMMQDENGNYKEAFYKEGYQDDAIPLKDLAVPTGYRIESVKKDGACDLAEKDGGYVMTFFTQNVTLKVATKPIKYSIEYDRNGDDKLVTGRVTTKSFEYNAPATIAKNAFKVAKNKYKFAGWNTEPDGSGKAYEPGEVVKNLSTVHRDVIKLYAQWKDDNGNLVTASLFSDGSLGIKAGAVLAALFIIICASRFSLRKRRADQ